MMMMMMMMMLMLSTCIAQTSIQQTLIAPQGKRLHENLLWNQFYSGMIMSVVLSFLSLFCGVGCDVG
jgi:hypothetical protein